MMICFHITQFLGTWIHHNVYILLHEVRKHAFFGYFFLLMGVVYSSDIELTIQAYNFHMNERLLYKTVFIYYSVTLLN